MWLGQSVRGILPASVKAKVPAYRAPGVIPSRSHARQVILLKGCVQPAMLPGIDAATRRVLDALQIQSMVIDGSGCCGALKHHMADPHGGLADARKNIDAWWPLVSQGKVEAIVANASGCGVMVKDYGHLFADDATYAEKAARISAIAKDPIELLEALIPELQSRLQASTSAKRLGIS